MKKVDNIQCCQECEGTLKYINGGAMTKYTGKSRLEVSLQSNL